MQQQSNREIQMKMLQQSLKWVFHCNDDEKFADLLAALDRPEVRSNAKGR